MLNLTFTLLLLIVIALPVLVMYAYRYWQVYEKGTDDVINSLKAEITQLNTRLEEPVRLVMDVERRYKRLTERLEQIEIREKSLRQYGQAIKLIKRGTSVEEVMSLCSLNRGEAELIRVMHEMEAHQDKKVGVRN